MTASEVMEDLGYGNQKPTRNTNLNRNLKFQKRNENETLKESEDLLSKSVLIRLRYDGGIYRYRRDIAEGLVGRHKATWVK